MSPEAELRFLILGAQREGNRVLSEQFAPLGLTPSQAEVIGCLAAGGTMSLGALGKLLVCEAGSPSRLVDALVVRGLVSRQENAADRRQVALALTPAGQALARQIVGIETALHGYIANTLGDAGVAAAIAQLRRLTAGSVAGDAIARRRELAE